MQKLFLSVGWSSVHYPEKLVSAMRNSGAVYPAWVGEKLIGLINALDDNVMTAYVHYLLIDPAFQGKGIGRKLLKPIKDRYKDFLRIVLIAYEKEVDFYKHYGFEVLEKKKHRCLLHLCGHENYGKQDGDKKVDYHQALI